MVNLCSDMSRWDPFLLIKRGTPLLSLAEEFARGVHRAAMYDGDDRTRITGILTQSAFVKWMVPRLNSLGDPINKTLRDLGQLGFGPVLIVRYCLIERTFVWRSLCLRVVSVSLCSVAVRSDVTCDVPFSVLLFSP